MQQNQKLRMLNQLTLSPILLSYPKLLATLNQRI